MISSSLFAPAQGARIGGTVVSLPGVEKTFKGNGLYQFPELAEYIDRAAGEMEWYVMSQLHQTGRRLLVQHGMTSEPRSNYSSFSTDHFDSETMPDISWLVLSEHSYPAQTRLCLNANIEGLDFELADLYVNRHWGDKALKLLQNGIVEIELTPGGRLIGTRWDNSVIQHLDLVALLRK